MKIHYGRNVKIILNPNLPKKEARKMALMVDIGIREAGIQGTERMWIRLGADLTGNMGSTVGTTSTNCDYHFLDVASNLNDWDLAETVAHECIHIRQRHQEALRFEGNMTHYKGHTYDRQAASREEILDEMEADTEEADVGGRILNAYQYHWSESLTPHQSKRLRRSGL